MRFEVVDGRKTDRWLVRVDKGDVDVKHRGGEADCVIRADRKIFEGMATGRVNGFGSLPASRRAIDSPACSPDWSATEPSCGRTCPVFASLIAAMSPIA